VQLLANANPRALDVRREADGNTPLQVALGRGAPLNLVMFLACTRPAALRKRNKDGFLPLHVAAFPRRAAVGD
jgi:ankyrin repeat protein